MRPILALALTALASTAHGADTGWEPAGNIRDAAMQAVARQLPATARASAAPLDERLRLPACGQLRATPPAGTAGAHLNVPVQCDGPVAWTVHVSVKVADIRPVVVLLRSVTRGERVTPEMLGLADRDIAALPLGFLSDSAPAIGMVVRRPLAAGTPLTPDALEAPRLIRRGELVTLVGRAGAVEVRAQGRALADGRGGEPIAVENLGSRRIVQGVVTAGGLVEVRL